MTPHKYLGILDPVCTVNVSWHAINSKFAGFPNQSPINSDLIYNFPWSATVPIFVVFFIC